MRASLVPAVHILEALDVDPLTVPTAAIREAMLERGADVPASIAEERDALLDLAMATMVASRFADDRITFLYDFPASQAALARVRGPVASRFDRRKRRPAPTPSSDDGGGDSSSFFLLGLSFVGKSLIAAQVIKLARATMPTMYKASRKIPRTSSKAVVE